MLEAGVRCAGVDEICPSQLPHVSETLNHIGIEQSERELVDSDVIPDGVAQYLEVHGAFPSRAPARQPFGPAFLIAESTSPKRSKFFRNIAASFCAWAS